MKSKSAGNGPTLKHPSQTSISVTEVETPVLWPYDLAQSLKLVSGKPCSRTIAALRSNIMLRPVVTLYENHILKFCAYVHVF